MAALLLLLAESAQATMQEEIVRLEKRLASRQGTRRMGVIDSLLQFKMDLPLPRFRQLAGEFQRFAQESGNARFLSRSYKHLGYLAYRVGNFELSLSRYFEYRNSARNAGDDRAVGDSEMDIGDLFMTCFYDYTKALDYYQSAIDSFRKAADREGVIRSLNSSAQVQEKLGAYDQQLKNLLEAYDLCQERGLEAQRANILSNLSSCYLALEDPVRAQEALVQSEAIFKSLDQTDGLIRSYSMFSLLFRDREDKVKALENANNALRLTESQADPLRKGLELNNRGYIYLHFGNLEEALSDFQAALAIREKISDLEGLAQTHRALGELYLRRKAFGSAESHFRRGISIASKKMFLVTLHELYRSFSTLYIRTNRPTRAMAIKEKADELAVRIFHSRLPLRISDIILEHEQKKMSRMLERVRQNRLLWIGIFISLSLLATWFGVRLQARNRRFRQETDWRKKAWEKELQERHDQVRIIKTRLQELEEQAAAKRYSSSHLESEHALMIMRGILHLMEKEKIYMDPKASLKSLSERLKVNTTYLSQVINENLASNFHDMINRLRVEEAKKLLKGKETTGASILEIALEVGFASKSGFNRIFKKYTGVSPSDFIHSPAQEQ